MVGRYRHLGLAFVSWMSACMSFHERREAIFAPNHNYRKLARPDM
jgi:hypothetical protein